MPQPHERHWPCITLPPARGCVQLTKPTEHRTSPQLAAFHLGLHVPKAHTAHRLLMSGNALSYAGVHPSTLVHTLHVITCQQLPIFYYIIPLLSLTGHLLRSSSSLNTRQDILESLISGEPASLLLNLATPCYALTKLDRKLGPREKTISLGARLMHGTEFILIIII